MGEYQHKEGRFRVAAILGEPAEGGGQRVGLESTEMDITRIEGWGLRILNFPGSPPRAAADALGWNTPQWRRPGEGGWSPGSSSSWRTTRAGASAS